MFPGHNGVAFASNLITFYTINKQITICSIIIQA